ncbi:hypothetical protein M413DRAFT_164521 [Hebeloma cylindrosporum]|uniref:Uncharacterized protein n=1 Tax=Hebeloma cylindrosporum TaxID=76867 RepID=A0A0C3CAJ3_HEBCY|nr:hypothetical protein M413DRAFT_164521 [Hebeloma cylindrosporum h7]
MESQQSMPPGQSYFDIPLHNQYMPDSPDTFYAKVQPPSSDSAHTPPSPITSRPRRSTARPSQSQSQAPTQTPPGSQTHSTHAGPSNNVLRRSTTSISTGTGTTHSYTSAPTQQVRKERERQLANTPRDTLIHLAISKEHEIKEAKHLLTTAILQIESLRDKLAREEQARKVLEEEKRIQGLKTTQAILKAQKESMGALESVGMYKLQIENLQMDLKRARDTVRTVEDERDDADRALVRARSSARQMKEQNVVLQAREEGRRQGFEEGHNQGRMAFAAEVSANPEPVEEEPKRSPTESRTRRKSTPPPDSSRAQLEAAEAAFARETIRIKMQLHELEKDLDRERQKNKESGYALEKLRKRAEEDRTTAEENARGTGERRKKLRGEKRTVSDI